MPPDALSLSRSELPEEIVEAIDALTRAHEEAAADAGWLAVPRTQEIDTAYEALTAAILSRLGEAAQGAPSGTGYSRAEPSGLGPKAEYPSRMRWQPISTVPLGVEVLVFGGISIMGGMPLGRRVAVIDDRRDLCRGDNGELRRTSPTMWTHLPDPPALSEAPPQGDH